MKKSESQVRKNIIHEPPLNYELQFCTYSSAMCTYVGLLTEYIHIAFLILLSALACIHLVSRVCSDRNVSGFGLIAVMMIMCDPCDSQVSVLHAPGGSGFVTKLLCAFLSKCFVFFLKHVSEKKGKKQFTVPKVFKPSGTQLVSLFCSETWVVSAAVIIKSVFTHSCRIAH